MQVFVLQVYDFNRVEHSTTNGEIPDFVIEPEIAMELLTAADFLDC